MKLSIIIPAYNEEKFIAQTISKVLDLKLPWEKEIIVVNDGSTDRTSEILSQEKIKIVTHVINQGKGAAIKSGLPLATGEWVIIQDADLEYDPSEIKKLIEKISKDTWAIYGNRDWKIYPERGLHYLIGAKILTYMINLFYSAKLKDVYTGYKLFNIEKVRNILQNFESSGFEFEAEITCKILKAGGAITEVPIEYTPRSKREGKKIKLKDAFVGAWTILKTKFSS